MSAIGMQNPPFQRKEMFSGAIHKLPSCLVGNMAYIIQWGMSAIGMQNPPFQRKYMFSGAIHKLPTL